MFISNYQIVISEAYLKKVTYAKYATSYEASEKLTNLGTLMRMLHSTISQ